MPSTVTVKSKWESRRYSYGPRITHPYNSIVRCTVTVRWPALLTDSDRLKLTLAAVQKWADQSCFPYIYPLPPLSHSIEERLYSDHHWLVLPWTIFLKVYSKSRRKERIVPSSLHPPSPERLVKDLFTSKVRRRWPLAPFPKDRTISSPTDHSPQSRTIKYTPFFSFRIRTVLQLFTRLPTFFIIRFLLQAWGWQANCRILTIFSPDTLRREYPSRKILTMYPNPICFMTSFRSSQNIAGEILPAWYHCVHQSVSNKTVSSRANLSCRDGRKRKCSGCIMEKIRRQYDSNQGCFYFISCNLQYSTVCL